MNFNLSQKSRVYGLRLVIGCVMVGILVVGGYVVVKSLLQPRTSSKIVESEQQVKNKEVRQGLPLEKTFLGKVRSEKDGVVRVQVRGLITSWASDSVEIRLSNSESVNVKFPAQVQYVCLPSSLERVDVDGGTVSLSGAYMNLTASDGVGKIIHDNDKLRRIYTFSEISNLRLIK